MRCGICALTLCAMATLAAEDKSELRPILDRLAKLEEQNRGLVEEVRSLRSELAEIRSGAGGRAGPWSAADSQSASPVDERMAVAERRIEEQAQSKVESDHRLPVQLTGMILFNAFLNGRFNSDQLYPTAAGPSTSLFRGGATFRQTVLGVKYQGPQVLGGAKVTGSLYLDLFGGSGGPLNQTVRLRLATVDLSWKNTSFAAGVDKPLLAPREPDSLAQVGVSPLTNAGNLWLWQPQARIEQRFSPGGNTTIRAQFGVFQTSESFPGLAAEVRDTIASARPAAEGRFEIAQRFGGSRAVEIAGGFHASATHLLGQSAPSRIWSLDWLIRPFARFDFSGAYFRGENVGVVGALRQGVIVRDGRAEPVPSQGGWAQLAYRATPRLTFNVYGGQQDDRNEYLARGGVAKNFVYAGNAMYRLGSNVLASFEASQTRTTYLGSGTRLNPHYDLAVAYLF